MESITIANGDDEKRSSDAIPSILQDALSVKFDTRVGHDYEDDAENRFEYYHKKDLKIPTGHPFFDKVMRGGPTRKTLNALMAPPHAGKTLGLVNIARGALNAGYNVLYITAEMAQEEISKRFDQCRFEVDQDQLMRMTKSDFISRINSLKDKGFGKLIVREFPTGGANANHFLALIDELKRVKNFVPD
jgi:predicted ATP-dependent serine protease